MNDSAGTLASLSKPHNRGCIRNWRKLQAILKADLYRYAGRTRIVDFLRHYFFTPGYKYTVVMRACGYLRVKPLYACGLYPILKLLLLRYRHKYGISIPEYTVIGPGLFINHSGGVIVNGDTVIGSNVNYMHEVTLGQANRGPYAGSPIIGDRVFLGPGSKIIGRIRVGNDSSIGANAVVTKDVPENGVVVGIPAKLISSAGSEGYINRQVPDALMHACADAFVGPIEQFPNKPGALSGLSLAREGEKAA